jgi:YegS/Rv2252/BmrU family lipid kinase
LIYNPRAGRFARGGKRILDQAAGSLVRAGHGIELHPTTGPGAAALLARQAVAAGADAVIVAGGDGTVNEAVQGLAGTTTPLAVLPAGTANVLAMETGLGRDLRQAAASLSACVAARVSLGRLTAAGAPPRFFLLMAGAGLDAHIVYHLDPALKSKAGKLAYWVGGFRMIGREFPEFRAGIDGRSYPVSFALVSKVRNYGGDLQIACETNLLDDTFEAVLFAGSSSYLYLKYLAGVATRRLRGMEGVTAVRTDAVELGASADQRIYVQTDGEFAGRLPARIEMSRDALTLLLPPAYVAAHRRVA